MSNISSIHQDDSTFEQFLLENGPSETLAQERTEEAHVANLDERRRDKERVERAVWLADTLFADYTEAEALAQLWVEQAVLAAEADEAGEAEVYRFDFKEGEGTRSELRTRNAAPLSNIDLRPYVDQARNEVHELAEALVREARRIEVKAQSNQITEDEDEAMERYTNLAQYLRKTVKLAVGKTMTKGGLDNLRELATYKMPKEYRLSGDNLDKNVHLVGLDGGFALDMSRAVTVCEETGEKVPAGGTLHDWLVRPNVGRGETRKARLSKGYIEKYLAPMRDFEDEALNGLAKEYNVLRRSAVALAERVADAVDRDDLATLNAALVEQARVSKRMSDISDTLAEVESEGVKPAEPVNSPALANLMHVITDGDEDMEAFLWEVAGRILHGDKFPQKTFGFLGSGGAGKGTFLDLLRQAFGTYAVEIEHERYFDGQSNNPEKVYALKARGVFIHEMETSDTIAAAQLKKATEESSARLNYSNEVVSTTQNTVVITMNNPFRLKRDGGVDRRLVVVPFGRPGVNESVTRMAVEAAIQRLEDEYGEGWKDHPEVHAYVLEQSILGYARMETSHEFELGDERVPAKVVEATEQFFADADPIASAVERLFEFTGDQDDRLTRKQIKVAVENELRREDPMFTLEYSEAVDLYRRIRDQGATEKDTVRNEGDKGRGFCGLKKREVEEETVSIALRRQAKSSEEK